MLLGDTQPADPRAVTAANFSVTSAVPDASHVLLIDDTWTSGGHALSAALSLKKAGAKHVSILVLARWLTIEWEATTSQWLKRLDGPDYDPVVCPWTQGPCPS